MNVDFNTLSSAVHLVAVNTTNNNSTSSNDVNNKLMGDSSSNNANNNPAAAATPSRRSSRRRSSMGPGNAKQFVAAAHHSWTFAKEDLPSGDVASQRRRSKRIPESTKLAKVGHRSFTFGEQLDQQKPLVIVDKGSPLLKTGSSKRLPPRMKTQPESRRTPLQQKQVSSSASKGLPPRSNSHPHPRRASISSSFAVTPTTPAPQPTLDLGYGVDDDADKCSPKGTRKLSRRSSLLSVSVHSNLDHSSDNLDDSDSSGSESTPTASPPARTKMARRNTIHVSSNNNDEENDMTQGPRRSSSKNSNSGQQSNSNKGPVRFELDHKNRIKRSVNYIRKQTSRTDAKVLWWSEADLDRIYERENRVYDKFSNDRRYKRAIRKMWGNCSKASHAASGSVHQLTPKDVCHVTGAPARGLEVDILEIVRDRRLRVIANLLDAQETLRDFDPTIRAKVLGARYKNLCKAATRFAQKMGEGDALEAANVYNSNNRRGGAA